MTFLTVLGHANIDVQLGIDALPIDSGSRPVRSRRTVYGGTGCNIARQAAALGVPTRLWARIGDDFPPEWRAGLEDDGLDLSAMEVDPHGKTPTCYVITDANGNQAYCMDQGAMGDLGATPAPASLAKDTMWLHVGTGAPEGYQGVADAARAADTLLAIDPGQELRFAYTAKSFEKLLDGADVLFVNEHELQIALDYLHYGDPIQLLDHVDTLIATRGAAGADLYDAKGHHHEDAHQVQVVDPTGAGDALRAGWYAGLHSGLDRRQALRWGMAAAAICVQHEGPQDHVIRRREFHALFD